MMATRIPSFRLGILVVFILHSWILPAQKKEEKKYPTLLWEITGNGLKKPSYLFGTMHVSSKMVFHLSDSFYFGIRNSEVVALELDPQLWQDQLFRYQNMQTNLRFFTQGSPNDYLNEKSFQLEKYEDKLKSALSEEPTLINGLLYRTFQAKADFEEDTYLDLYIYQTGKKLGKQATGVENYFETERLILEATQDMMHDKRRRNPEADGESIYEIERKSQEAYRKGDLDMLDSLERIMQPSKAYLEKFLYRRNEIQANSVDSILKVHSLFVGVGAAHLPGKRGVIELLRRKGYHLRPISMRDQDALQRDDIDKVKVPVNFAPYTSEDRSFTVQLPGKLYKRTDSKSGDSWQYADMSNGAYYMITRVKTHGLMTGQSDDQVLKKIDSLLYENVPGKILKKTPIIKDGYKGYDITNKTRRGDLQRYNIVVTPFEILLFKMSGNGSYVDGREADIFFGSIQLKKNLPGSWSDFDPIRGGFKVRFPEKPSENLITTGYDGIPRWEYEANDSTTGDAYMIWRKSVQNYRFLDEDTFDLGLMEESFGLSDWIEKELTRQFKTFQGYSGLDALYLLKDASYIYARFIIKGPHYYLLAVRTRNGNKRLSEFFESFAFTPYRYEGFKNYTDSIINISVRTPIIPDIDIGVRNIMERGSGDDYMNTGSDYNRYWPKNKTALFQDDSTGEAVYVSVQPYPRYYFPKDSASFWKDETNESRISEDFIVKSKNPFRFNDSVYGVQYLFADTNSTRIIHNWIFVKDNRLYRVINLNDSQSPESEFVQQFYSSLRPLDKKTGESVFNNKLSMFFGDLFGKDSITSKKARDAVANVNFGSGGVKLLIRAIQELAYNDKDYFQIKSKLIKVLGSISDSASEDEVVNGLKQIFEKAKDTSTIQNAVFRALAKNKSRKSYALLKTLLVQDPPLFDNSSDYNDLFQDMGDSLALAKTLFPELLQLSTVDDYKEYIRSLLSWLVDSNYLKPDDYKSQFSKLFFDAKIQLKKQHVKDEKKLQNKNDEGMNSDNYDGIEKPDEEGNVLGDYAVLLMPFYDENSQVREFFEKLLCSKDAGVRLNTVILLIRNNKKVADSIIRSLAASDRYRSSLLKDLEDIHREDKFPSAYKQQVSIARSQLVAAHTGDEFYDIEYVSSQSTHFKGTTGYVYFFKYKIHKDDDWMIGLSGIQPADQSIVGTNDDLVRLTNKKIRFDQPLLDQFAIQLKRFLFSKHKSATSFYFDNDYYIGRGDDED